MSKDYRVLGGYECMVISCNAFATHYRARGGCESPVTASVDGTDGSSIVLSNDSFMLSLNWVLAGLREDRVFEGRRNPRENLLFRVSFAFLHNVLLSPIAIPYSSCLAASCPRAADMRFLVDSCLHWHS